MTGKPQNCSGSTPKKLISCPHNPPTRELWSQGSFLSHNGMLPRPCPRGCSASCGTPGSSASSAWLGKSEQRQFPCSLKNPGSVSFLPHFIVQNMECLATRRMFGLSGKFPLLSNHSDYKFLVSENFWELTAISFILWVTLLGRIVSIYWWANQVLEISNNVTWLSGIIRFLHRPVGILSANSSWNQCLMPALVLMQCLSASFSLDGPCWGQPPHQTIGYQLCTPSSERRPRILPCSPFLPSALLPASSKPAHAAPKPHDPDIF